MHRSSTLRWSRRFLPLSLVGVLALSSSPLWAQTTAPATPHFPEPSYFPISWELKFKHSDPKRIVVSAVDGSAAKAFWYITYTVTNLGNDDVEFDPVFEMLASDGKTYRGNRSIPGKVFDTIKQREGNRLLETPRAIVGTIHPGEEQAKDGIAIWEEPVRQMGTFSIFVAGLSGETVTMKKSGTNYVVVDPKNAATELKDVREEDRMQLRKQYQVTYRVLGDDIRPGNDPVEKRETRWVMR